MCKVVVLLIKPVAFLSVLFPLPLSLLKLPLVLSILSSGAEWEWSPIRGFSPWCRDLVNLPSLNIFGRQNNHQDKNN